MTSTAFYNESKADPSQYYLPGNGKVKDEPPDYLVNENDDFSAPDDEFYSDHINIAANYVKTEIPDDEFNDEIDMETSEKGIYPCKLCGKVFKYTSNLRRHGATHVGGGFQCQVCKRKFVLEGNLRGHDCNPDSKATVRKVLKQRPRPPQQYNCKVCNLELKTRAALTKHQQEHFNSQTGECKMCYKVFRERKLLQSHMNVHTSVEQKMKFSCIPCNKTFAWSKSYRIHMDKHSNISYKCDICGKCFSQKGYLSQHRNVHSEIKKYACAECSKTFAFKRSLIDHLNIHLDNRQFTCQVCNKKFNRKDHLRRHQYQHGGILGRRSYPCYHCSKLFCDKHHLERHLKILNASYRYRCRACPKSFSWKRSLEKHRTLYANKANGCAICHIVLFSSDDLLVHMQTHVENGFKPTNTFEYKYKGHLYCQCECCDTIFRYEEDLMKHTKAMLRHQKFMCDLCTLEFTAKTSLEDHIAAHCLADKLILSTAVKQEIVPVD